MRFRRDIVEADHEIADRGNQNAGKQTDRGAEAEKGVALLLLLADIEVEC